eukprot:SAG22_NODE_3104_length_1938_cov_1.974986_1_plen_373_part_00
MRVLLLPSTPRAGPTRPASAGGNCSLDGGLFAGGGAQGGDTIRHAGISSPPLAAPGNLSVACRAGHELLLRWRPVRGAVGGYCISSDDWWAGNSTLRAVATVRGEANVTYLFGGTACPLGKFSAGHARSPKCDLLPAVPIRVAVSAADVTGRCLEGGRASSTLVATTAALPACGNAADVQSFRRAKAVLKAKVSLRLPVPPAGGVPARSKLGVLWQSGNGIVACPSRRVNRPRPSRQAPHHLCCAGPHGKAVLARKTAESQQKDSALVLTHDWHRNSSLPSLRCDGLQVQDCLVQCLLSVDRESCATKCLVGALGLSTSCASCWVGMGDCILAKCKWQCVVPTSKGCASCSEQQCFPAAVACTGLPVAYFPP